MPPMAIKTIWVIEPCWTCRIWCGLYTRFFLFFIDIACFGDVGTPVPSGDWVENPFVKECLLSWNPKSLSSNDFNILILRILTFAFCLGLGRSLTAKIWASILKNRSVTWDSTRVKLKKPKKTESEGHSGLRLGRGLSMLLSTGRYDGGVPAASTRDSVLFYRPNRTDIPHIKITHLLYHEKLHEKIRIRAFLNKYYCSF